MHPRTLDIARTLLLLPALALAACDPKLDLGDLFGTSESSGETPIDGTTDAPATTGGVGSGDTDGTGDYGEQVVECDLFAEECPAGQKCAAYRLNEFSAESWDAVKCVPLDPNPVPVGSPCENPGAPDDGLDNCELGSMCWDVDPDTGIGVCVAHCQGSWQAPVCAAGRSCVINNSFALAVCLADCDALVQDCAGNDTCVPVPGFQCMPDVSGAEGQVFDPCESVNACDPGLVCVASELASECDPQSASCCLPLCETDNDDCPGVGQHCLPWFPENEAPQGGEKIGLCQLPP